MASRILVDTNILLDYLLTRAPFCEYAKKIIVACTEGKIQGCIAAHSISNMFYILRKDYSIKERREALASLCLIFDVEGMIRKRYWWDFRMRIFLILRTAYRWSVQRHIEQNIL